MVTDPSADTIIDPLYGVDIAGHNTSRKTNETIILTLAEKKRNYHLTVKINSGKKQNGLFIVILVKLLYINIK